MLQTVPVGTKQLSNEGKVSCSRKQRETFDGVQTHDWQITIQKPDPLSHWATLPLTFAYKTNFC